MTKLKSLPNFPRKKERNNPIAENVYNNGEVYGYNKCLSEVGELDIPDYSVPSKGKIRKFLFYYQGGMELHIATKEGFDVFSQAIHNLITKRGGGE